MPPLSVGFDLLFWHERAGGVGSYARDLLPALRAAEPDLEITAYVSRELPEWVPEHLGPGVRFVRYPVSVTHGPPHNALLQARAHWVAMAADAHRHGLHVVHGLANLAPLWAGRTRTVVTLHDLIWLRDRASMGLKPTVAMVGTAIPSALRATRVIAVSHAARRDIVETLRLRPDKVDVVWHGRDPQRPAEPAPERALRERYDLGDAPVVLCIAQKRTHKNLHGLVRAFARLADARALLVLPGAPTPYEGELRALASELGIGSRVRFPAWLEESELEGMYALADVFALASFEEGFGLPVLDAMARGLPVACSAGTALEEVAGGAAETFDPRDPAAIAAALDRLLADPRLREQRARAGRERAATFTWERAARETLAVYRRAAA